ncbi:hypothetical protein [Spirillospora sp. CA-294931]|uniref:hypothetical protein n=1 Tax=Spirillospora sp. CA-294931 TaxID=3240042 RepID=UPI003D920E1A
MAPACGGSSHFGFTHGAPRHGGFYCVLASFLGEHRMVCVVSWDSLSTARLWGLAGTSGARSLGEVWVVLLSLADFPGMANSALWVGILTALTALGASYITARATFGAAQAQAETTARAESLREERERRRAAYREMMSCAHAFSEVTWQIDDVDAARGRASKDRLLTQMCERIGPAIGDMNRAMHEVRLDGPASVSDAADHVRDMARRVQQTLKALVGDDSAERRDAYDAAYRDFREAYVTFIGLAREALEVEKR